MPSDTEAIRGVSVILDRPRLLRLDFNALEAIERATGRNMLEEAAWKGFDTAASLRVLIWALLRSSSPELTIEDVGAMLTPANFAEIQAAAIDCISKHSATSERKDDQSSPFASRGAAQGRRKSSTSGRSRATTSGSERPSSGA